MGTRRGRSSTPRTRRSVESGCGTSHPPGRHVSIVERTASRSTVLADATSKAVLKARQRSVSTKEIMMAEKRTQRMKGPGQRVRRRDVDGNDGSSNSNGRGFGVGAGRKRQRVGGSLGHWDDHNAISTDTILSKNPEMMDVDDSPAASPVPSGSRWVPPVSPYGLVEEDPMIYSDPFKLLVACILLNKTTATQVRHVLFEKGFFDRYPSPESVYGSDIESLESELKPLGLWRKRAVGLQRFSREYVELFWDASRGGYRHDVAVDVGRLHGVGKYAKDAYSIFVMGAWKGLRPDDKDLKRYIEFLERTEGVGVGFMR
jgi:methyl-CpG-binding domain protein 4